MAFVLVAGCNSESGLDLSASKGGRTAAGGIGVGLASITGAPASHAERLERALSREATARAIALASAAGPSQFQMKVFVDAFSTEAGETALSWIIEVSDNGKQRAQRLQGVETIKRRGEPWSNVDDALMARAAAGGMNAVAIFLAGGEQPAPAAPAEPPPLQTSPVDDPNIAAAPRAPGSALAFR